MAAKMWGRLGLAHKLLAATAETTEGRIPFGGVPIVDVFGNEARLFRKAEKAAKHIFHRFSGGNKFLPFGKTGKPDKRSTDKKRHNRNSNQYFQDCESVALHTSGSTGIF